MGDRRLSKIAVSCPKLGNHRLSNGVGGVDSGGERSSDSGDDISDSVGQQRRDISGNTAAWLMNGGSILQSGGYGAVSGWKVVGQRDFNADGKYDLLWRDGSGNTAIGVVQSRDVG